jgi:proton glutamate symport protein
MVLGALWGSLLHDAYFADFETQARAEVLEKSPDKPATSAQTKTIGKRIEKQFKHTGTGGAAFGLAMLFMKLLKMIMIPLVLASLICGILGMGDFKRLGRIGGYTALWYLGTTAMAIITGLILVNIIEPGVDNDIIIPPGETILHHAPDSIWDMFGSMVPSNVFESMAQGKLLPIIFFAILFGIFLLKSEGPHAEAVKKFFHGLFEVMMKLTSFIILLAPIGIAALIAKLVATTGPDVFVSLAGYAATVAAALAIHFFGTLPLMVYLTTRQNPYRIMRKMSPALLTAFSTASSAGTLPVTLERLEHGVGIPSRIGGFVLPLGATVNMDGTALYECVATLFVAQLYAATHPGFVLGLDTQLTIVSLALLVSIGAAGIPHAGLVMMIIIFEAIGLPIYLTALLWAVDRPLDMCRTATNVWSDTLAAVFVSHIDAKKSESPVTTT